MRELPEIAIVGGESLIGRELRELLQEEGLPARVRLIGVDEDVITLTEEAGEPAVIPPLDEERLLGAQIAILAGTADSSRKALAMIARSRLRPRIVDMSYAAENEPSARLRAPALEPPGEEYGAGVIHTVAHPAAVAIALLLLPLEEQAAIRRVLAHVFEPASERGQRGLDELRQQTVSLLSFQPLPKRVFDAQLGFNLLSRYGSEAPESLLSAELRIEKHLASLLARHGTTLLPSLRLVQAPVFHGYSISLYAEFARRPDIAALVSSLASAGIDVRVGETAPPDNAGIAGQSGVAVGAIAADRNHPDGVWFWAAADNLRLMAENGVAVVRSLLSGAAQGPAV